jgi:diacylglycerol kinase family enzyme
VDGKVVSGPVWLVTVANARYYGGGMKIAPCADPQDGLADIIIVGNIHRLNFLRLFPLVYSGRHIDHPAVQVLRGKEIRIDSVHKLAVHADGDLAGTTPVEVKICHHVIRLRVPE